MNQHKFLHVTLVEDLAKQRLFDIAAPVKTPLQKPPRRLGKI